MEISKKQKIFGSWWVLLSCIIFLNGLGLIFAGVRTKYKKWTIFGLLYIIISWILMSLGAVGVYFLVWIVSIIHTIYIRKEYFVRVKVLKDSKDIIKAKKQNKDKELINKVYKDILGEDKGDIYNDIENNNSENLEEKLSEIYENDTENIQKLNINTCSDAELSQIPGIGIILSKKAMDSRMKYGSFTSMDEFYSILNISSEKRNKLNKYLECIIDESVKESEYKENDKIIESKKNNAGRKIDF